MAHAPLITRAELPRYGVAPAFLAQFDLRPIEVTVSAAGALGTASFEWRRLGDTSYNAAVVSSSRAPWSWSPPGSFAVIAFASGSYVADSVYTIDEDGTVTRSGGAINAVTATRFDPVTDAIAKMTDEATDLMQPRYTLPIIEWGAAVRGHAAAWVKYLLKCHVGFAPSGVNPGDDQIVREWDTARAYFGGQGAGKNKSPDISDSSVGGSGAGLSVRVSSDPLRGW